MALAHNSLLRRAWWSLDERFQEKWPPFRRAKQPLDTQSDSLSSTPATPSLFAPESAVCFDHASVGRRVESRSPDSGYSSAGSVKDSHSLDSVGELRLCCMCFPHSDHSSAARVSLLVFQFARHCAYENGKSLRLQTWILRATIKGC